MTLEIKSKTLGINSDWFGILMIVCINIHFVYVLGNANLDRVSFKSET